jgi:spermidine synthase
MIDSGKDRRGSNGRAWWHEHDFLTGVSQSIRMRLLHAEQTPYQKLEIYEHEVLGRVLVLDDILQTTQWDEFVYHEMLAHVPLLGREIAVGEHTAVLIIGGGDGGLLREVLKHDWVRRVVMVELDERVVQVAREYLGINGDYDDPRVELLFDDGAAYVKSDRARAQPFDAVIVDATDPLGPGEALFSEEFFRDIGECLSPTGVTVRHVATPAYTMDILKAGFGYLKNTFGNAQVFRAAVPTYIGGDMGFVIAAKDGHRCDIAYREFRARYYNRQIHASSFALPAWWSDELRL